MDPPSGSRTKYSHRLQRVKTSFANGCVLENAQTIIDRVESWSGPTVSRRKRPAVLFKSPTSIGPYYRRVDTSGVLKGVSTWICGTNSYELVSWQSIGISSPIVDPTGGGIPNWSNRLAAEVKDLRVNLASDIAEHREGINACNSIASSLLNAVRDARQAARGQGPLAKRVRKFFRGRTGTPTWQDVPAAWLGINLAALPTIGTVSSLVDKLRDPNESRPLVRRIRFTNTAQYIGALRDSYNRACPGTARITTKTTVMAFVELRPPSGLWVKDNTTPGNPLEGGYELIPLSFVLDWFIPVGQYLSGLDAYEGITGIWGTISSKSTCVAVGRPLPVFGGQTLVSDARISAETYQRTAFSKPPPLTIPKWSPTPSVKKLVTALSLLAVQRR